MHDVFFHYLIQDCSPLRTSYMCLHDCAIHQLLVVMCIDPSDSSANYHVGPNPCTEDNGGCSYLCLLSAVAVDGYTCTCPDDLLLDAHGRNCSGAQLVFSVITNF